MKNFLKVGTKVIEAVKIMDETRLGLVLITNDTGKLAGVLSDSDVRRALVNGVSLDVPVEEIMTVDPISIHTEMSNEEIVSMLANADFQTRDVQFVPVLSADGTPKDICRVKDIVNVGSISEDSEKVEKIMIIGGAGYIGSVLARQLLDAGYEVVLFDKMFYDSSSLDGIKDNPKCRIIEGDTRHIDELMDSIKDVNAVVHLAELVGDPLCARDSNITLEINYLATAMIARMCSHLQINRFIYVSSCSVYGASADPDTILDETSPLLPVSLYAKTKINAELSILGLRHGNFSPCILRLGTVFGNSPRPRYDLVVNILTAKAVREGKVPVFGGNQWRPHVHVTDVADAIKSVLEAPLKKVRNQVFNVVGENLKIIDLAEKIVNKIPGATLETDDRDYDMRNYRVSGDKIKEAIGYSPKVTVDEGIVEMQNAITDPDFDFTDKKYSNIASFQEAEA